MFYKGHRIGINATDIVGGVRVEHNGERHVIARRGTWEGHAFSDIHAVAAELKALIDAGEFESVKQLPEYK